MTHIGYKQTEEHKRKAAEARRGKYTGSNHWMYGKHHSEDTKRKMSIAHTGYKQTEEHKRNAAEAQRGRRHSEESKQRMSEAHKGYKRTEESIRKTAEALPGRKRSEETKRKISESLQGMPLSEEHKRHLSEASSGSKSYRWKGGPVPYGVLWLLQRRRVRSRDNYMCQLCGATEEELGEQMNVHHIVPFRETHDNTLENLICLCGNHGSNNCHILCEYHPEKCPESRKHWLLPVSKN